MIESKSISKVFEKVYSIKKLKPAHQDAEKKLKAFISKQTPPSKRLNHSKTYSRDLFSPMNDFVSITSGKLNVSQLYKNKILPSQYLSTSKKNIKKLTRKIYISPKHEKFPLLLPESTKNQSSHKRIVKTNQSFKEDVRNASFEVINKTCEDFLKENQASRKMLRRKSRQLSKKVFDAKKILNSLQRSNKRAGYYLFQSKLKEGHKYLEKLDLIHPKNP